MSEAIEKLERKVAMTTQVNLLALDKTLAAIKRSRSSYVVAAVRCGQIAERIVEYARGIKP